MVDGDTPTIGSGAACAATAASARAGAGAATAASAGVGAGVGAGITGQPTAIVKPRPRPTPTSQPFWDALRDERIVLQRCGDCGSWVHYPRSRCVVCLSGALEWIEVSGRGTVHTFAIARVPTAPPFADEVPQILAVVEIGAAASAAVASAVLAVRMSTTLVTAHPESITVGMAVEPVFDHGADGMTLLRFRPADEPR